MFIGICGIALFAFSLSLALNYKGLAEKYFHHLSQTNYTSHDAKPSNLKFVGWVGVFVSTMLILGGFFGTTK